VLTGLFCTVLQQHFADVNNIENPILRTRIWTSGESSAIAILDAMVWDAERTAQRPSLAIKRGDWHATKLTIGNQAGTTADGHSKYVKAWQGTHTCFCIGKTPAEVEVFAAEVSRYFMHFGPLLRATFDLYTFDLAAVGTMGLLKEASDRFVVPVTVQYSWVDEWVLRQHVPLLKSVRLSDVFPELMAG